MDKIFTMFDVARVLIGQSKSEFPQCCNQCASVFRRAIHKQVSVLGSVREAEKYRPRFAEKEIPHAMPA